MKASLHMASRSVIAMVTAVLLAGCAGGSPNSGGEAGKDAGSPQKGGHLVSGIQSNPTSIDSSTCNKSAWDKCQPIYGTLLRYNVKTEKFEPAMAQSFDSTDGKVWTLKLRENVKFSDGTPYDADAVDFNWKRSADPATRSPAASLLATMKWKVIDPLTVEITLAQPNFQLPWALQFELAHIGSPTAIMEKGADFGNRPVGAGPFLLEEFVPNSHLKFVRNPTYWEQGLPYLDAITQKLILGEEQRMNALKTGEIKLDLTQLKASAEKLEKQGFKRTEVPQVGGFGIMFNYKDPDLKDPDLRLALNHAFNPDPINSAVYVGAPSADTYISKESRFRGDDSLGTYPQHDIVKAQQLFDRYLAKTGKSGLTLKIISYAGFPALSQATEIVQGNLQAIKGLTVELEAVAPSVMVGLQNSGEFQLAVAASTTGQSYDALYDAFRTGGLKNVFGYSNPKVDEALDITRRSNNPDEVAKAYQIVNGEISKDAPVRIWGWDVGQITTAKDVHGLMPAGLGVAFSERLWLGK